MPYASRSRVRGFSLLELVVAMAILALSLGALYQATTGATRNVQAGERYAYGIELARSLLADHARVPPAGVNQQGETAGGFAWRVASSPLPAASPALPDLRLHALQVVVSWRDGPGRRSVALDSVVPEQVRK